MSSYAEKLRDPRWQKKRLEIMKRDGFACKNCGDASKTLNVHHSAYVKGCEPWEYDERYLHTVCERCHQLIESDKFDLCVWLGADRAKWILLSLVFIGCNGGYRELRACIELTNHPEQVEELYQKHLARKREQAQAVKK